MRLGDGGWWEVGGVFDCFEGIGGFNLAKTYKYSEFLDKLLTYSYFGDTCYEL